MDEYSGFLQNLYLSGGKRIAIVLAIRPGVSGWMRRTLHQLVYCTVGPVPLELFDLPVWPWGVLKILRDFVTVWFLERHLPEIAAEK
ncbi:putative cytoplasmic protein [Salmonella enterica subsp. enterica]|nr:putative cytoplasmic protein [Salmonella enterica subsp. enterica]